jgi:hypothetical protein
MKFIDPRIEDNPVIWREKSIISIEERLIIERGT